MTRTKRKVLFICVHNRCRSQMAEAYARHLAADCLEPASAGLTPTEVDPRVIRVMDEVGVPMSTYQSKAYSPHMVDRNTLVVTVCREADEGCPIPPEHASRIFWPLPDPSRLEGHGPEVLEQFRELRADIRRRVLDLAEWVRAGLIS